MDFHSLSALLFGNGVFWLICTAAAGLCLWRHYTSWGLVSALAIALSLIVVLLMVCGWLFPAYVHVWDPAVSNLPMIWGVPMVLLFMAAVGTFGGKANG